MSRNARKAHRNNEHPLTYWKEQLGLDKETLIKMLIFAGIHHTGLRAMRTRFYRLPDLKNEKEYRRLFDTFHSIPARKKKFIDYMARKLQDKIDPQNIDRLYKQERPNQKSQMIEHDFPSQQRHVNKPARRRPDPDLVNNWKRFFD
jgi:hypothetical protein